MNEHDFRWQRNIEAMDDEYFESLLSIPESEINNMKITEDEVQNLIKIGLTEKEVQNLIKEIGLEILEMPNPLLCSASKPRKRVRDIIQLSFISNVQ